MALSVSTSDTDESPFAELLVQHPQESPALDPGELPESLSLSIASQCRQILLFQDRLEQANRNLQSLKPSDWSTCFLTQQSVDPLIGPYPCISQAADSLTAPTVRRALRDIDAGINAVGAWLRNTIDADIVRRAFPADLVLPPGVMSSRALDIPELLENILGRLSAPDLLQAEQVNRRFREVVAGSSQLQIELYRRPDQNSKFRSFLQGPESARAMNLVHLGIYSTDLRCEHYVDPLDPTSTMFPYAAASFNCSFPTGLAPRIGSNIKSMLLCQPPMKILTVSTDCCTSMTADFKARLFEMYPQKLPANNRAVVITSERGFTVGDLADISTRMSAAHRLCPYAPVGMINDDGCVYCNVTFAGRVQLQLLDPFEAVTGVPPPPCVRDEPNDFAKMSLLRRYRRAKIAGKDSHCANQDTDANNAQLGKAAA